MKNPTDSAAPSFWRKLGGGSLSISIAVHAILLTLAVVWIFQIMPKPKSVEFLPPSGGGGPQGSVNKVQAHKCANATVMNTRRVVAAGRNATFSLPEPDRVAPTMTVSNLSGGGLAGGLGGSGSGGGRGNGAGPGFGPGAAPGLGGPLSGTAPFIMFNNPIRARSIGVVLDVSGSMSPHLAKVVHELDRVAAGSPLILYNGCGIGAGEPEMKTFSVTGADGKRFEGYWRLNHGAKLLSAAIKGGPKIDVDYSVPMPVESLYQVFAKRPHTFYIDSQGTRYSWAALLSKELKDVEAVYWFSDFQDAVDEKVVKEIARKLRGKKQKLYVHASVEGRSFPTIKALMVEPTDGAVIEVQK